MQERLRGYYDNLKTKWDALERNNKIKLIAVIALVLLTIFATIFITTKTTWIELIGNLDGWTYTEIESVLNDEGIKNKPNSTGSKIMIDEKDKARAKIVLSASAALNTQGFTFADALSNIGMSTTSSQYRDMMVKAAQTELAQAMRAFDGVESATVILNVPPENGFYQQTDETATASVFITQSRTITSEQARTMATFVCRSVRGLEMENIIIANNRGESIYSGMDENGTGSIDFYDLERKYKMEIESKIKQIYYTLFDEIQVMSNIVIKKDKTTEHSVNYSLPTADGGLVDQEKWNKQTVTDSQTPEEPGLGTNDNTGAGYNIDSGGVSSANINSGERNILYDSSERMTEYGVGEMEPGKSSVAVVAYKYVDYYESDMTLEQMNNMKWTDFKTATKNETRRFTIEQVTIDTIAAATGISNVKVEGFEKPIFHDAAVADINIREIVLFTLLALFILMLAYGLIKKNEPAEVVEIEPELSVEDLLVSTQLEEQKAEEAEKLLEIDFAKESEFKKQIEKIIVEKPEAVVQLLRTWINEKEWE